MDELKPTGFETADALDRLRAVRRGMPYKTLWPSDVDEAIEALEDKLNRRPAPENKPNTRFQNLVDNPEKIKELPGFSLKTTGPWIDILGQPHTSFEEAMGAAIKWLNSPMKPEESKP